MQVLLGSPGQDATVSPSIPPPKGSGFHGALSMVFLELDPLGQSIVPLPWVGYQPLSRWAPSLLCALPCVLSLAPTLSQGERVSLLGQATRLGQESQQLQGSQIRT